MRVGIDQRAAESCFETGRNDQKRQTHGAVIFFGKVNGGLRRLTCHERLDEGGKPRGPRGISVATARINWPVHRSKFPWTSGSEMGMTYKGARARRVSLPGEAYPVHSEESPANLVYVQLVT